MISLTKLAMKSPSTRMVACNDELKSESKLFIASQLIAHPMETCCRDSCLGVLENMIVMDRVIEVPEHRRVQIPVGWLSSVVEHTKLACVQTPLLTGKSTFIENLDQ